MGEILDVSSRASRSVDFSVSGRTKSPDSRKEPETAETAKTPSPSAAPVSPVLEKSKTKTNQKSTTEIEQQKIVKRPSANRKNQVETKREEKKYEKVKSDLGVPQADVQKNAPPSVFEKKKALKEESKKEVLDGSAFEEIEGPSAPVQTGSKGIKNKMRWKIDVEVVDVKGDQRMTEIIEKASILRTRIKARKCKFSKENEKDTSTTTTTTTDDEPEPNFSEEMIIMCARVLEVVKLESLISKEISKPDQINLRAFCRCGDHEENAEICIEKIASAVLNTVVQKNEFIRQVMIPGELRMFAVDEKKAKIPMMALMMVRKDLTYFAWEKRNKEVENTIDGTWSGMSIKKGTGSPSVYSTQLGC
ncbi:DUF7774 domain-containing protein [Caenorhabditis elegans]|nr:THUMP domain-containing protein [Caenorhabditis elegans]CAQ58097.1 THUMP domain-containing protein [Caenorhabditis elegans]|eukprot:NP_001129752.1 Uncharacterized protein CELE_C17E4.1 [Caenorhabditis elegans]